MNNSFEPYFRTSNLKLMTQNSSLYDILAKYIPSGTVDTVAGLIIQDKIKVKITKDRFSKHGDYRPPQNGHGHRISINYNLNKYAFLITLVHEIAHLKTWQKFQRKVFPHGEEWKHEFKVLLFPFLNQTVFPQDILRALNDYIKNPAAASCSDLVLQRTLKKYDEQERQTVHVEDMPEQSLFRLSNGMTFIKGKKLRKRFQCTEIYSNRKFMVHPLTEVVESKENNQNPLE